MSKYNQSCYKFVDIAKTWTEAEAVCQGQTWKGYPGHLASIHSEEENTFVASLATERFWLGGNELQKEGDWKWSDGSAFIYHNWYPSNTSGNENCMELHNLSEKKWNDIKCDHKFMFVCKFTKGKEDIAKPSPRPSFIYSFSQQTHPTTTHPTTHPLHYWESLTQLTNLQND